MTREMRVVRQPLGGDRVCEVSWGDGDTVTVAIDETVHSADAERFQEFAEVIAELLR